MLFTFSLREIFFEKKKQKTIFIHEKNSTYFTFNVYHNRKKYNSSY